MRKPEGDPRKLLEDAIGGLAPDGKSLADVWRSW
jgi:hypothetical protein